MRSPSALSSPLLVAAAVLSAASLASADQLVAYLEGAGLAVGTRAYNCNIVDSQGVRGHIQATAFTINAANEHQNVSTLRSGTSQSVPVFWVPAKKHRVELQTHMFDRGTGEETTTTHCDGGWTAAWLSSGTANVSQCARDIRSATSQSGGCSMRNFQAASMGNNQ